MAQWIAMTDKTFDFAFACECAHRCVSEFALNRKRMLPEYFSKIKFFI